MTFFEPLLALAFLAGSAFFSAAETALVTLSTQKTKHLALQYPKLTNHLIGWLARPHELIIVILIGSTISVILFAAFLTSFALKVFDSYTTTQIEAASWLVQTFLMLIFGEMVPKFLGRLYPEQLSLLALPWLGITRKIFAPIVRLSTKVVTVFMPSWVSTPISSYLTFSIDELRSVLEEAQPRTVPQKESLTMMQRVIDITKKSAQEIMTPIDKVDYVDLDLPVDRDDIIDLMIENGHTRTPVRKNKDFVGYIHTHDLIATIVEDRGQDFSYLVLAAHTISPTMHVSELLQLFKTTSVHLGFVRGADNAMIGLVSLEDVLEEITGEILDEYDVTHAAANP